MHSVLLAALALAAPQPQAARQTQPVDVEVVGSAHIDVPASFFVMKVDFSAEGKDHASAEKAYAEKKAAVMAVLAGAGVPASAVGPVAQKNPFGGGIKLDSKTVTEMPDDGMIVETVTTTDEDGKDVPSMSKVDISDSISVRVASVAQAQAVKAALEKLEATVGDPDPALADADAAHRQAKAKAVAAARADAEAYASALGMRVQRVTKISEAGGIMLPELQGKVLGFLKLAEGGQNTPPGTIRVDESVTVNFVIAP